MKHNTRYIVGVFRNSRGDGLLTVFARSKKEATQRALQLIGKRKLTIGSVEPERQWATKQVRQSALDYFIWKHWNPLMHRI